MAQSADPEPSSTEGVDANVMAGAEPRPLTGESPPDDDATPCRSSMPRWIRERTRYFWLSLTTGLLAALVASFSFTDPWPSNLGGFVFVVTVVSALTRGGMALVSAFRTGWREEQSPTARQL